MIANVNNHSTHTEKTENTEFTESTENTSETSVFSVFSDNSVFSDTSVHSVFSVSDVQIAAERCIPRNERDVNRSLFKFARELRAMLPNNRMVDLEPYVEVWHKVALDHVSYLEWSDVWFDFIEKWDSVKFPAGKDPLDILVKLVDGSEPPECAKRYGGKVGRLVHILQRLQMETGDKPFFMSGRTAARIVGTTHTKAALWLRGLIRDGVIAVDHSVESNEFRARRYRYIG